METTIRAPSLRVKKNRIQMKILRKVMINCREQRLRTRVGIKNQREPENWIKTKLKITN